jgi:diaminopimelate epimerase
MIINFYKYQGAGNDFILIDNRVKQIHLSTSQIEKLCDRHFGIGADGLILIENSTYDFKMIYYNSDGKESSMCGNGGRCAVSFAYKLGMIKEECTFEAIDGLHFAQVIKPNYIRLQMQNVSEIKTYQDGYVLNTGSPHFVKAVKEVNTINVYEEGRKIRYNKDFNTQGINVNFLQIKDKDNIIVRTYERGVENETLACGTGVTACALVTANIFQLQKDSINVQTLGGLLKVEFEKTPNGFQNIFLSGNADYVFKGEIEEVKSE